MIDKFDDKKDDISDISKSGGLEDFFERLEKEYEIEFQSELNELAEDLEEEETEMEKEQGEENDKGSNMLQEEMTIYEDAKQFHHAAQIYAEKNFYQRAINTCLKGLAVHKNDKTLMADLLKLYFSTGQKEDAENYYKMLCRGLKRDEWNEICFENIIEYLIDKSVEENKKKIVDLLAGYKKRFPDDDGLAIVESDFEFCLGNYEKSIKILEDRINRSFSAPRSALKLLEMQIRKGEYEKAQVTGDYYEIADWDGSDKKRYEYLYLRCRIEDALLHKNKDDSPERRSKTAKRIRKQYNRLLEIPDIALRYEGCIRGRLMMLDRME